MKILRVVCVFCGFLSLVLSLSAQTYTTLYSFCQSVCMTGDMPVAPLLQATDGNLYGTASSSGVYGYGTVFKISPSGTLTAVHSFDSTDGANPGAPVVQAADGNFYGTTEFGGANGDGTVFKITANGTLTTLHSFDGTDGANPVAGLVQATDGNFYGTTLAGSGTVFKITASGTLTTLHSFDVTDGSNPEAGLIQATDGSFYGTTNVGGANGDGTVFKITANGTLTTLHSFDGTDGANPRAGLIQATEGNFYGTTEYGGTNSDGTVFKITPSGTLTTLHSFDNTDGANPGAGLVQATDGNFYGTTFMGGDAIHSGTIFEITSSGTLTTVYSFRFDEGGAVFSTGLFQDTNGTFYGTSEFGGASRCGPRNACGSVFSLSIGLGPFVETQTTSGKVGAAVKILGTDLTGATSVTFNRTGATFTVVSSSEITTTVPAGATTGLVQVVTPGGTLTSRVKFRVN